MSPEKQRVAIADACGWQRDTTTEREFSESMIRNIWVSPNGKRFIYGINGPPDYPNDLNAMHEAYQRLSYDQRSKFHKCLVGGLWNLNTEDLDKCSNATAAQRAEAFLRAIGKWKEGA